MNWIDQFKVCALTEFSDHCPISLGLLSCNRTVRDTNGRVPEQVNSDQEYGSKPCGSTRWRWDAPFVNPLTGAVTINIDELNKVVNNICHHEICRK
jgi:hypothetical protein